MWGSHGTEMGISHLQQSLEERNLHTVEKWLPMRGIIRISENLMGGSGKFYCDTTKIL